jgi:hypothetical protein
MIYYFIKLKKIFRKRFLEKFCLALDFYVLAGV